MARKKTEPTRGKGLLSDGYSLEHPSFGAVQISRVSCNPPMRLYASSVDHANVIMLRINRSTLYRSLHEDKHYGGIHSIVEVTMSANQFAEAITSLNCGSGVPCTINFTEKDGAISECADYRDERREVRQEFQDDCKAVANDLLTAVDKLSQVIGSAGAPKKGDLREVLAKLTHAVQQLESNMPFVLNQFDESCDKVVAEAKGEIDAAFTHVMAVLANEKLIELGGLTEPPKANGLLLEQAKEQP